MNFLALISGGKDSILAIKKCVDQGHNLVCLGNLAPVIKDELDSFMFQTVGHEMIPKIAEAMNKPLIREDLVGSSQFTDFVEYGEAMQQAKLENSEVDEVLDLEKLLSKAQKQFPEINAVSCGAILSNYQRSRVEHVCKKLGLTVLSPLWQYDQMQVLDDIVAAGMEVVLSKTASLGLNPMKHVGKSIDQLYVLLKNLADKYDINPAGEGGEFESLCLYWIWVLKEKAPKSP